MSSLRMGNFTRWTCLLAWPLLLAGCTQYRPSDFADQNEPAMRETPQTRAPVTARRTAPAPLSTERSIPLGRSHERRPIDLVIFGRGRPALFIMGGIHGNEPNSADLAKELIKYLRVHPEACKDRTVGIVAEANPDGLAHNTRTNVRGVDLNRNFPTRNWRRSGNTHGPSPVSEPETAAIMTALRIIEPDCIVAIHAISGGRKCNNYDGPGRALAEIMNAANGYPVQPYIGHPTPGSLGSWAGIDREIPTLTLELPKGQSSEVGWAENRGALLSVIDATQPAIGR